MSDLADMVGAPKKVTIKGREYQVSPLTINDLAEFEAEVKKIRSEDIRKELKEAGLPDEIVAQKIVENVSKSISMDDVTNAMGTMRGTRYLLWCALRKNHKELKLEDMGDLITLDNFDEATGIITQLGGRAVEKAKNARKGKATK